jgi:predicted O-linked N-acetylglucosamine transferase (SPINDLY family)
MDDEEEQRFEEAVSLHTAGELAAAERAYLALLAASPDHVRALNNLAQLWSASGRLADAVTLLGRALALAPGHVNAHCGLGVALHRLGRLEEAAAALEEALALDPDHLPALNNLAMVLTALKRPERALALFQKALRVDPGCGPALQNLGVLLAEAGQLSAAVSCYRKALGLDPRHAPTHGNLANALCKQGLGAEALVHLGKAIELAPGDAALHSNLLLTLHYVDGPTPAALHREHLRWARLRGADRVPARAYRQSRDPDRRLRVGYVSPDLRAHAVAFFLEPILDAHDRERFALCAYAEVPLADAVTARLRGRFDRWCDTVGLTDACLVDRIVADEIDVLVDLAGHTSHNRLLVFAQAPAPVALSYLGYPDTTAVAAIGYRLTDALADPPGGELPGGEALLRIDGGMHCFRPSADAPEPAPPPRLRNGHLTFGSFHNTAKVGPGCVQRWAKVLAAVPRSRLLLKFPTLADADCAARYRGWFARAGVDPARIEVQGGQFGHREHLAAHGEVDVVLDAFPYHGTTTTCEALWMGVPVLTRAGETHASRVGSSLLAQVGLGDWVARSDEQLVELAVGLDGEPEGQRLAELRTTLRSRMAASPLCDGRRVAAAIEACFRMAWRRFCVRDPA